MLSVKTARICEFFITYHYRDSSIINSYFNGVVTLYKDR